MAKLTEDEALKIYRKAWSCNFTMLDVARKCGISKGYVAKIKHGVVWSDITGHQEGVKPSFAYVYKPKILAKMSIDQKLAILLPHPDVNLTITDREMDLCEEFGSDIAYEFKQKI